MKLDEPQPMSVAERIVLDVLPSLPGSVGAFERS
jgi:hypothetical protein